MNLAHELSQSRIFRTKPFTGQGQVSIWTLNQGAGKRFTSSSEDAAHFSCMTHQHTAQC